MTYQRRLLSGGTRAPVRPRHVPKLPGWLAVWSLPELELLDVVGTGLAYREAEANDMERRHVRRASPPPVLPTTLTQSDDGRDTWDIRTRIKARVRYPRLWRASKTPFDFQANLIARLLLALEAARGRGGHHSEEDITAIQDQLLALGVDVPES